MTMHEPVRRLYFAHSLTDALVDSVLDVLSDQAPSLRRGAGPAKRAVACGRAAQSSSALGTKGPLG